MRDQGESIALLYHATGFALYICQDQIMVAFDFFKPANYSINDRPFHWQIKVYWDIRWVRAGELGEYAFCPADVEVAERFRKGVIEPHIYDTIRSI